EGRCTNDPARGVEAQAGRQGTGRAAGAIRERDQGRRVTSFLVSRRFMQRFCEASRNGKSGLLKKRYVSAAEAGSRSRAASAFFLPPGQARLDELAEERMRL